MEWISIEDESPPLDRAFLGFTRDCSTHVFVEDDQDNDELRFNTIGWECCHYCGGQSIAILANQKTDYEHGHKKITHWMELPGYPGFEKP